MADKNVKAWATFEDFNHDLEFRPDTNNSDPVRTLYRMHKKTIPDDPTDAYIRGLQDMFDYSISQVSMNEKLVAEENSLKNLVGKSDDEELDIDDARTIGKKISKMHGDDRKKFIGIVNFMGASCRIYNEIWANYKPVDPTKKKSNKGKEFRGDKEIG